MDYSDSEDEEHDRKVYRFKERKEYTENEREFKERYRLTPRLFEILHDEIGDEIERDTNRDCDLSSKQVLLAALRFYASGSFYYTLGDSQGVFFIFGEFYYNKKLFRCIKNVSLQCSEGSYTRHQ